jgi:hypothetical protein
MAYEVPGRVVSKITAASFASGQYRACVLNSSGLAAVPANGAAIYGVVQNDPASGESAAVMIDGVTKWEAGAAIAAGANVATENDGRCITAAAGDVVCGIAEVAAGAAGVYIAVKLDRGTLAV